MSVSDLPFERFICEARVTFRGKELALNKIVAQIALDEIAPSLKPPLDPFDLHRMDQTRERRLRFVDMIAAEFAHALTEALYKL